MVFRNFFHRMYGIIPGEKSRHETPPLFVDQKDRKIKQAGRKSLH
jgi:hypothetical protein